MSLRRRSPTGTVTRAAAVVVVLGALSGCIASAPHVATSGRYSAVIDAPQSASGNAAIAGSLAVDDKGCWGLSTGGEGDVLSVIWPAGTSLSGTKLTLPGIRQSLDVGAAITGGGGVGPASANYPPCIAKGEEATYLSGITLAP